MVFGAPPPTLPAKHEGRPHPAGMREVLNTVLNIAASAVPEGPCPDASHGMLARMNVEIFPALTVAYLI